MLTSNTLFLVSGGGRGITAQCVIQLASHTPCRFILIGRSPFILNDPEWAAHAADSADLKKAAVQLLRDQDEKPTPKSVDQLCKPILAAREIRETISAIEQTGSQAWYLSADISNSTALANVVHNLTKEIGPITGIIHGAGVIADKLIEQKSAADFDRVFAAKVTGLHNMLNLVELEKLRHLILFSSVAGFFGNVGQTDYAAANEILNKTAHLIQKQYPGCQVHSINWGAWDGGMVTAGLKRQMEANGIQLIPLQEGTQFLAWLMQGGTNLPVQILAGMPLVKQQTVPQEGLRTFQIERTLREAENPFLRDHRIGTHAVLPKVCALAWMANSCEQLYPGFHLTRASQFKTLKGIVFDGTQPETYTLDLVEIEKSRDQISFKAKIWSKTAEGRLRFHFSADLTVQTTFPQTVEINPALRREAINHQNYYTQTLFHGPAFQGIQAVTALDETGITIRCQSPAPSLSDQGRFRVQSFNPFAADIFFQAMVIWVKEMRQSTGLPLQVEMIEQFAPIPFEKPYFIQVAITTVSHTKALAIITASDEDGRCLLRMSGAQITLNPGLTRLFNSDQQPTAATLSMPIIAPSN